MLGVEKSYKGHVLNIGAFVCICVRLVHVSMFIAVLKGTGTFQELMLKSLLSVYYCNFCHHFSV
jgi:hypothetical protein